MNAAQKILLIMGIFYVVIGGTIALAFLGFGGAVGLNAGGFIAIPLLFVVLGIAFIAGVLMSVSKKKKITKQGRHYLAKIYSYVNNTSYMVNGQYTVNVKVHYFDENHVEREAILPTSFPKGSNMYPIGMTIDIFEYQGQYGFDPKSVRNEVLPGEIELMDDKPVSPEQIHLVAVRCPSCGSSFQAAAGYASKCPYCGSYLNV